MECEASAIQAKSRFGDIGDKDDVSWLCMRYCYANGLIADIMMDAEGVRFELTRPFGLPVFKTGAFNRSATPPKAVVAGSVPSLWT
jgi:hypothetical protein